MFSLSIKKTPFSRLFLVSLIIVMVFNLTFNTKRAEATTVVAGLTVAEVCAIIGAAVGVTGVGIQIFDRIKAANDNDEQAALDFCRENIQVNGDGNYVVTGQLLTYCEQEHTKAEDAGYTEFVYPSAQYVNPDFFSNPKQFQFTKNTISSNPDWWFKVWFTYGNVYLLGSKMEPLGVVASRNLWGMNNLRATMYNTDWNTNFQSNLDGEYVILCISSGRDWEQTIDVQYCQGTNAAGSWVFSSAQSESINGVDMDKYLTSDRPEGFRDTSQGGDSAMNFGDCTFYSIYGIERAWVDGSGPAFGSQGGALFHGTSGYNTIEVYSTLNGLKKGTYGITKTQLTPDYKSTGVNDEVTPTMVTTYNNITDSYNNTDTGSGGTGSGSGSGSGSDDDNGSGSGWLDKIIDGLGSIGSALLNIVGVILEWVGKAIDFVTESLNGIIETVTGNLFRDFLIAVFPFVPEEVWTGVMMIITLSLFGTIITFLRK